MLPADLPAKRIMRLFIVLLLVGLHLCACQEDKRVKEVDAFFTMEDFGPAIRLKGEILPMDSIWKPARIRVEDSLLILTDMTCDYFIQVYDKRTGKKQTENLSRGSGPGELMYCWSTQYDKDKVWAFDMQMARLNEYARDSFLTGWHVQPQRSLHLQGAPTTGAALPDGTFIGSSLSDKETLFTRYDSNGRKDSSFNMPYPEVDYDIPEIKKKDFWEHRIYYSPRHRKVVVFYTYTDLIEIYDEQMKRERRVQGPDQFGPEFGIRNIEGGYVMIKPQKGISKLSYISGVLTDTEMWTLYRGCWPTDGNDARQTLLVFDYEGNPLRHYELDMSVQDYAIDEEERCIYALTEHPDPVVVRYPY